MAQRTPSKKTPKARAKKKGALPVARKAAPSRRRAAPAPTPKTKPAPRVASAPAVALKPARKNRPTTLSKTDLQYFRGLLLEKRREILGDVGSMESEAFKSGSNLSNMPIHMADVGTDNFEQEFTLGLIESERQILREIQEALIRIDTGTYGICQGTGKPIPRVRLEAVPWAKYTIEYSRLLEAGKVSPDGSDGADDNSGSDEEEE